MSNILLLTVGGSCEPLVTAIRQHRPRFVYFLCSDDITHPGKTAGSYVAVIGEGTPCKAYGKGEDSPSIVAQTGLEETRYEIVKISHMDNLAECYEHSVAAIEDAKKRFPGCKILANYTGGTKTMTAGLVAAALDDGEVELFLVGGDRVDLVKVRSGSQRVLRCDWMPLIWRKRLALLKSLFSRYNYTGCLELVQGTSIDALPGSKEDKMLQTYQSICSAFLDWDRFNHLEALGHLNYYGRHLVPSIKFLKEIIASKKAYAEAGKPVHLFAPVFDLLRNAERRLNQQNYDDAVARTYRSLEMLAQFILFEFNPELKTENLNVDLLPGTIKPKYQELKREAGTGGKLQLPLFKTFELLLDLGHPVGKMFAERKGRLRDLLVIRNNSILAHGFIPINSKRAWEFFQFVREFAVESAGGGKKKGGDWEQAIQFPTELPDEIWQD